MGSGEATGGGFGALLRSHRSASGLTQEDLASLSGLSVRAISNMERGRTARPYRGSVQSLADALALPGPDREQLAHAARAGEAANGITAGQPLRGHEDGGTQPPMAVPRQLPAAVPHFAGRADELSMLTGLLDAAGASAGAGAGTVTISAITGTAGIGKTTLAVHWAHQVADRFPDGQLYVNLRGFDPSGDPVPPAEAVRGFLDALGVPSGQIPATTQAQAGLYRSTLAGRRMLIVLDNARDAAHVRPLLPGSPACLVVVTSRSQLAGLVAADGARPLLLDMLTQADAGDLLTRRLGPERLAREPRAAADLIELCARLPLALAIVAARAAVSPALALHELAGDLGAAASRLDAVDTGEAATSLRAAFSWSYQMLSDPAARLFRLLGIHPGPDITAAATASLAGIPVGQSRALLRELTRCHLATEHFAGRFAFHDMLRVYADERAGAEDSQPERRAAIHRVLDHYLHTARAAALLLFSNTERIALAPPQPAVTRETFAGSEQAMDWLEAERRVLLAVIAQAASSGFDTHACQLPSALTIFLDRRGYWNDYAAIQQTALAAGLRMADRTVQAGAYRRLGHASTRLGSFRGARAHFKRALPLYRQLGDRTGEALVYIGLAFVFEQEGRHGESLALCLQALDLARSAGELARQANILNNIGWCHAQMGNYQQALASCHQAIALYQQLDDPHGEAATWDSVGYAHYQLGDYAEAASCHQQAARQFGESGDRHAQAVTLTHLGDTYLAADQPENARESWQQALATLDDMHHAGAEVRARLQRLDSAAQASHPQAAHPQAAQPQAAQP